MAKGVKTQPRLIDPKQVESFLARPYALKAAWDKVATPTETPPADCEQTYTPEQVALIRAEAQRLYKAQTQALPAPVTGSLGKIFKLSAGAPGAGKTMLLEKLILTDTALQGLLFSDPDERALKLMPVFKDDITAFGGGQVGLALAYTKWRWASNFISNWMLNKACAEGRNILLGTTATSATMPRLYANAHNAGYSTETIIVCAPESVRTESARRRFEDEGTRFTNDTRIKGALFYERLPDLMAQTDAFRLYWRDNADSGPVLVATGKDKRIAVLDAPALKALDCDLSAVQPARNWARLATAYSAKP